jgi:hypothetical protein
VLEYLQERKDILTEDKEIILDADPKDEALNTIDGLQEQVDLLTDKRWIIEFQIVTKGKIPDVSGGKITVPGGQHGLDFIVPSGYKEPYQPFLFGAESGERVTVTPHGQSQGRDVITNNHQYVTQNFHSEGAAALGMAITRKFGRDRLNASMGR